MSALWANTKLYAKRNLVNDEWMQRANMSAKWMWVIGERKMNDFIWNVSGVFPTLYKFQNQVRKKINKRNQWIKFAVVTSPNQTKREYRFLLWTQNCEHQEKNK